MSPSVLVLALVVLASSASSQPSDEWAPRAAVHQGRAFASRRSYSVSAPAVNAVHQEAEKDSGRASTNEVPDDEGWFSWLPTAEMRVIGKVWDDCAERDDMTGCLKGKALTFLERASRKEQLSLPGGLQLVRTARSDDEKSAPLTEATLEKELPRDLSQREQRLDEMLIGRLLGFFQTHAIRFNLADESTERGIKKKDLLPYLLLGKLVTSSMVAMAFTGLALLAGKALMVSKIALILSGIVALKKLFSHGHSGGGVEVVNVPSSGHGYGRSFDADADDAQSMAYRGQIQRPSTRA